MTNKKSILSCDTKYGSSGAITFKITESGDPADNYYYRYSHTGMMMPPENTWISFNYLNTITVNGLSNGTVYTIDISSTYNYYYSETSTGATLQFTLTPQSIDLTIESDVTTATADIAAATTVDEVTTANSTLINNFSTAGVTDNDKNYAITQGAEAIVNATRIDSDQINISLFDLKLITSEAYPDQSTIVNSYISPGINFDNQKKLTVNGVDEATASRWVSSLGNFSKYTASDFQNIERYSSSETVDIGGTIYPRLNLYLDDPPPNTAVLYDFEPNITYAIYGKKASSTSVYPKILKYIKNSTERYLEDQQTAKRYKVDSTDSDDYTIVFTFANTYEGFVLKALADPGGNGGPLPCLCEDTDVFTTKGYVNVKDLKVGDKVITPDYRIVEIKDILSTVVKGCDSTYPYIIKEGSISMNYPPKDTKISKSHMIKYNNSWIKPLKNKHVFAKDTSMKSITYYHIELENYITDHLIVNGGLVVESYANNNNKDYVDEWNQRDKYSIRISHEKPKKYFNL